MIHPPEIIEAAKKLYLRRHKPREIAELLGVPLRTVYEWRKQGQWDDLMVHETIEESFTRRLALLAEKENKTKQDLDEIKTLTDSLVRIKTIQNKASQAEEREPGQSRKKKRRNKKRKNDVSMLKEKDFKEKLHKKYFDYQHELRKAITNRTRILLKSRQIGATWYFAQEAFEDASLYGRNKIFLSATRAQAEVFRRYIIAIAKQEFDIELTGNPLILHTNNGPAELHFLSNNSKSAQSYHGDVYIDEFFWIQKFNELYKLASAMATHSKWRKTLFSTPSAVTHEAYDLWTGDRYNQRFKKKRVEFPGFKQLQSGILCPDNAWRKIITIEDAIAGGCNLFDLDILKLEYSPSELDNLFYCLFVDDTFGVFKFADLEGCGVDTSLWHDIDFNATRPVGNLPVWGGYDPSRSGDDASFVILLPPLVPGGKFRVIKRFKWVNKSFVWQADEIKKLCQKYNFTYMGIDVTGPGLGVFDTVKTFYHLATPIHYSVSNKTLMVLKGQEVVEDGRIQWDARDTNINHAFLTIRKTTTPGGQITYAANRTDTTGHADAAWSILHALANEPISHDQLQSSSAVFM
ncbi:terminase large subunit domain-containing protein [Desulfosediminicola sp.]|uniref:terminase large subunit domain-containing protein n=1 Tax=Desulfosediminicola sp. TaxID=2886825 RepID=UPI003AF23540